jgi:hypothetical protein
MKCYIARILQLEIGTLDIMVVIFNIMYMELTYQHLYHHLPQDELGKTKPIWLFYPC